jgi:hypothetical protein
MAATPTRPDDHRRAVLRQERIVQSELARLRRSSRAPAAASGPAEDRAKAVTTDRPVPPADVR